ncbi:unnamed protein product [Rotaria sp. Silwood1]|nr:unnamed protein product [Rotaria sp. Silwood1]CAF1610890.1 unnamed protein product [Rotaria sp. Silwood1]CAF3729326.1 unnamed protein product [Rotaria sp. Silwood1]CAF3742480.1 unnamed protein product [Rotaria sp. Silwood1]CAF4896799.1 unnamed protein product [Rotaria sp. Silwood1]
MIRITNIETLPNEILLYIFSYLSWFDMLTSLWSLNIRFNSLVCSTLSINDNLLTLGLSYNKCSTLLPLIFKSSSLCSSIQHVHCDKKNSMTCDLIYQWLFNDKKIFHFPNLKSLILIACIGCQKSIEPVFQCLFHLIENQLDELALTFNGTIFRDCINKRENLSNISDEGN